MKNTTLTSTHKTLLILLLIGYSMISFTQNRIEPAYNQAQLLPTNLIPSHIELLIDSTKTLTNNNIHKNYGEAISFYLSFNKTKDQTDKAEKYNQLGVYFLQSGVYPLSLQILLKAKQIAEKENDNISLTRISSNLGALYFLTQDYHKALELFNLTLDLNNKLLAHGNNLFIHHLQTIYINIACTYRKKGDLESAIKQFNLALDCTVTENKKTAIAATYLGEIYLQQQKFELAGLYIKKGLNIFIGHSDITEILTPYNNLTQYYLHTHHTDSAITANTKAIALARNQERYRPEAITKAYELKMDICQQTGKYKEAFEASQEYNLLNRQQMNASLLQTNKQLYLHHKWNELLNNAKQEQKVSSLKSYFSLALIFTIGTMFILLFLLCQSKIKQNQIINEHFHKELNIRKKELDIQLRYLQKKSKLISRISKHLLRLSSRLNIENDKIIEDIIADLQNDGETNDWREFTQKYQSVYTDFYNKLQTKSPDLTASELKTCSLLRLGMNSQDIAQLIHQNTRSIEVKRSRIRRKLKLTNTDTSLSEYLKNL